MHFAFFVGVDLGNFDTTVKLGYNDLGYNELPLIANKTLLWLVQVTLPYYFPGYNEQNPGYNEQKWKVFFKLTKNKHFFSLKVVHFTLFKIKKN